MQVFIKSFGCSANLADGEVLAGCLAKAGYKLVDFVKEADVIIYNTCAVKGPTENRMIEVLKRVPVDKKLIVAGCLPLINFERLSAFVRFDGAVGPAAGEIIVDAVERVLKGEKPLILKETLQAKPRLDLPRVRLNPLISIVPINYGCLGSCAYCCVIFARGHLRSCSIKEIVDKVNCDLAAGVREFWLTSQDIGSYGRDIGTNLAELLRALCALDADFKVRVGMMTPNMVMDILDELIEAYRNEKIFKFLHLPLQSGDNQILRRMRRLYSVEDFKKIIKSFKDAIPQITIATDVICGFPGEDDDAFKRTMQIIEEVKPDIVNVSKFFARPRTLAAKMHDEFVPRQEIKLRSSAVAKLSRQVALENNSRWLGWKGTIFIEEKGKKRNSWVGRNFAYKPIAIESAEDLFGKNLKVEVVKAFSTHLEAVIIE